MTSELKQLSLLWRHCRTAEKHIHWAHFWQLYLPVKGCRLTENVTSELISDSCTYLWKVVGWQKMWPVSSFLTAVIYLWKVVGWQKMWPVSSFLTAVIYLWKVVGWQKMWPVSSFLTAAPTCEREAGWQRGLWPVRSFQIAVSTCKRFVGWQRTVTSEFISDSCAYLWKGSWPDKRSMTSERAHFRQLCLHMKADRGLWLVSTFQTAVPTYEGWQRTVTGELNSDSCAYIWRLTEDCD